MVERMKQIISEYQRRIVEMPYVPKRSHGHSAVGINGSANLSFLTFLFSDKDLGIQFLKDVGLICSKVPCNTCGRDMTWCADPTTKIGFRWRCHEEGCWGQMFSVAVHQAQLMVPAESLIHSFIHFILFN